MFVMLFLETCRNKGMDVFTPSIFSICNRCHGSGNFWRTRLFKLRCRNCNGMGKLKRRVNFNVNESGAEPENSEQSMHSGTTDESQQRAGESR